MRAGRAAAAAAGQSAEELFELGLRAHHKKIRWIALAVFGPFCVAGLLLALLLDGQWDFAGGCIFGVGLASFLWVRDPPAFIETWRRGFEGERKTARALARLQAPWRVIHDVPAEKANRDHLVIGPGGLFLIDTKNLQGEVTVSGDELTVSRYGISAFDYRVPQGRWARGAAVRLHGELKLAFGEAVRVRPVIALWSKFPARTLETNGVAYLHGEHIASWLLAQPSTLTDEQVAVWTVRLQRFAAALQTGEGSAADISLPQT
jgi:hypothetical protein